MPTKETIAIVGATEKKGVEISRQLAKHICRLLLISNDTVALAQLAKTISEDGPVGEIEYIDCIKDGCWEADIIIIAVPFYEEKEAAERMREVATQKIVVLISENESEADTLRQLLPYSKVVRVHGKIESKEMVIEGYLRSANEEILSLFQRAGFKAVAHLLPENSLIK